MPVAPSSIAPFSDSIISAGDHPSAAATGKFCADGAPLPARHPGELILLAALLLFAVLAFVGCGTIKLPGGSYAEGRAGFNKDGPSGKVIVHIPLGQRTERRLNPPGAPFPLVVAPAPHLPTASPSPSFPAAPLALREGEPRVWINGGAAQ